MNKGKKILELLSKIPIDLEGISQENMDQQILRAAIISEYDAINLYSQMMDMTEDEAIRETLLHVINEEKDHIALFQSALRGLDPDQDDKFDTYKLNGEEE